MNTLIIFLIAGIAYWRIRNLYYKSLALEYKHMLYALRDKTRRYAIEKKISPNDKFFNYLDTSICVTIKELDYLNLLTAVILSRKHKDDVRIKEFGKAIKHITQQNEYAKELFAEYGTILVEYVSKKHYIIKWCLKSILNLLFKVIRAKKHIGEISETVQSLRVYPETSSSDLLVA
ncbi:hypothetical protein BH09BAC5_BH09BAC5_23870 [soil metagenome]